MRHVTNQENTKYKDLKSDSLTEQLNLVKQFKINYITREKLMDEEKKPIEKVDICHEFGPID